VLGLHVCKEGEKGDTISGEGKMTLYVRIRRANEKQGAWSRKKKMFGHWGTAERVLSNSHKGERKQSGSFFSRWKKYAAGARTMRGGCVTLRAYLWKGKWGKKKKRHQMASCLGTARKINRGGQKVRLAEGYQGVDGSTTLCGRRISRRTGGETGRSALSLREYV